MNAMSTQLRDLINSGLTRWRISVSYMDAAAELGRNPVRTRFSLSMEMSRLTRDGTAEPVSRAQILGHERGQGNLNFSCSADHVKDSQPYPVGPYSCCMFDHTYILTAIFCFFPSSHTGSPTTFFHVFFGHRISPFCVFFCYYFFAVCHRERPYRQETVDRQHIFHRLPFENYRIVALPSRFVTVFRTVTPVYPEFFNNC